jgi:hypothetical protein
VKGREELFSVLLRSAFKDEFNVTEGEGVPLLVSLQQGSMCEFRGGEGLLVWL